MRPGIQRGQAQGSRQLGRHQVGSVKEQTGDYDDALRNKKALVIPMILEAFGGISPHSLHFIRRLPMILELEAFGGISPHSLHFIRRLALRAKGARARQHRLYGGSSRPLSSHV